jgi:steroid 5-alpha reductase family enzyme
MTQTLLINAGAIALAMIVLWIVATLIRDASIVDPFWGMGFVLVAGISWALNPTDHFRIPLLAAMVAIWGLRLSVYLLWRNWGRGEDRRYVAMRQHHGPRFWWVSLFTVFLLQAAILWFVSLPIQASMAEQSTSPFGLLDVVGISLWLVGLIFETVGDLQLARFLADPMNAGKVMDRGLWRFSRHPDYFGDFCVWWGFYLVAAGGGAAWTIGSPLVMSFFLLRISGVTLLERTIVERRPGYAEYLSRTNAFFPGLPRKKRKPA